MHWYIPSWSGDFRLDPDGSSASYLVVNNPTPDEIRRLARFLTTARSARWCSEFDTVRETGESVLRLAAPVETTGPALAQDAVPRSVGMLTAVRSVNGKLYVDTDPTKALAQATQAAQTSQAAQEESKFDTKSDTKSDATRDTALAALTKIEKDKDREEEVKGKGVIEQVKDAVASVAGAVADAAVTVAKPTLCCPVPVPGPIHRASEVLKTFCTPTQWESWVRNGWLIAYGGVSGHAYRIAHRHSAAARAQGKITWDLDDDCVIHCYEWSVPPPEEVLAVKLVLEHREPWIRNPSGALMARRDVFANPLGSQGLDGTDSAGVLWSFGRGAMSALEGFNNVRRSVKGPL